MAVRGLPKIRGLLATITQTVVKNREQLVVFGSALQTLFNAPSTKPMVLVSLLAVGVCGLNLQDQCRWVVLADIPGFISIGEQAAARIHRIGQVRPCIIMTFTLANSFDDRQITNNLRKAVPEVMESMNHALFDIQSHATEEDGEIEVTVGHWVQHNDTLIPIDGARRAGLERFKVLSNEMGISIEYEVSGIGGDIREGSSQITAGRKDGNDSD